jgi:hypothetical protein
MAYYLESTGVSQDNRLAAFVCGIQCRDEPSTGWGCESCGLKSKHLFHSVNISKEQRNHITWIGALKHLCLPCRQAVPTYLYWDDPDYIKIVQKAAQVVVPVAARVVVPVVAQVVVPVVAQVVVPPTYQFDAVVSAGPVDGPDDSPPTYQFDPPPIYQF